MAVRNNSLISIQVLKNMSLAINYLPSHLLAEYYAKYETASILDYVPNIGVWKPIQTCFFEDSWYITLVSYLCFLTLLTFTSYTYIGPILNQLLPLPILFQFRSAFCKWSLDFINLWISHVGSYCVIFFISKLSWLPLCFLPLTEKNIFGLQDNIIFLWRWLLRLFTFPTYFWRWILLLKCL